MLLVITSCGGKRLGWAKSISRPDCVWAPQKLSVAALPHCVKPCGEISASACSFLVHALVSNDSSSSIRRLSSSTSLAFAWVSEAAGGCSCSRLRAAGCSISGRRLGPAPLQ